MAEWECSSDTGQLGHSPLGDGALLVQFLSQGIQTGVFPEVSPIPELSLVSLRLLLSVVGEPSSEDNSYIDFPIREAYG